MVWLLDFAQCFNTLCMLALSSLQFNSLCSILSDLWVCVKRCTVPSSVGWYLSCYLYSVLCTIFLCYISVYLCTGVSVKFDLTENWLVFLWRLHTTTSPYGITSRETGRKSTPHTIYQYSNVVASTDPCWQYTWHLVDNMLQLLLQYNKCDLVPGLLFVYL